MSTNWAQVIGVMPLGFYTILFLHSVDLGSECLYVHQATSQF